MTVAKKNVAIAIGILAAGIFGAWHWTSDFRCSLDEKCVQLRAVTNAIRMYKLDTGVLPRRLDDLFSARVAGWHGPYLLKEERVYAVLRRIEYTVEAGTGEFRLAFRETP